MNKIYLALLLLVYASGVLSQNDKQMDKIPYANEWKIVADFEQKSLPQSALKVVNNILSKAIRDKNAPQVVMALILQGKYDLALDAQNDTVIFGNLHGMLAKSNDAVEQSVLHSMLGELYLQYYHKEQWVYNQRTDLGDFVPADMKEWTRNIFYNKAIEHLNASIAAREALEKTKVESYSDVVAMGEDSRRFYPTMYDFLAHRAIKFSGQITQDEDLSRLLARKNISQASLFAPAGEFINLSFDPSPKEQGLWALENYRKLLSSLLGRGMRHSVLLTELDKLDYLSNLQNAYATVAIPSLKTLLKQWDGDEFSVEVINKMADFYQKEIGSLDLQDSLAGIEKTKALYGFLKENIEKYPHYERISVLENRFYDLTQPQFSVTGNKTFPVNGVKTLKVKYRNMRSLTARLYRVASPVDIQMMRLDSHRNTEDKRTFVKNITVPLSEIPEYLEGETDITVDVDSPGAYLLMFDSSSWLSDYSQANYYFAVSDLAVFTRLSGKDTYDFFVVNRMTGEPVNNAKIEIFKLPGNWRNYFFTLEQTIPADEDGLAVYNKNIPNNDILFYHVVSGDDKGSLLERLPFSYFFGFSSDAVDEEEDVEEDVYVESEAITIFTDRSLYRPGQTVFYKAILTRENEREKKILPNRNVEFVLWDANGREISKNILKTNDWGSVSGEFVLPQDVLPGYFMIGTEQGGIDFRVEEYKRPTFEVTFSKPENTYKFGEEITLKGKAESFSGISLQQADVAYRITRGQLLWRMWGGRTDHYAAGRVTTGDDGGFEISFTPEKTDNQRSSASIYFFTVEAKVTDINGETQSATYTVTVGDVSMILSLGMPGRWAKESGEKITVSAINPDGNDITAEGTYQLFAVRENDSIGRQFAGGSFQTGEQPAWKTLLSELPSGKYRWKLQSEDNRGNPIDTEKEFILFSYSDKRPPVKTNDWFIEKNLQFAPGKNAEALFGVSEKSTVLYELWQENNLLERKWIGLNNETRLFSFPYKEQYKEGITLMLSFMKGEKFYSHKTDFFPAKEQKELKVKLDVFRDKIRPGAEEEWRITVTDKDGKPSAAEVLASMYDFSLDPICPSHDWNLSSFSAKRYAPAMQLAVLPSLSYQSIGGYTLIQYKAIKPFVFDRFYWFDYSLYHYGRALFRSAGTSIVQEYDDLQHAEDVAEMAAISDAAAPRSMLSGMASGMEQSMKNDQNNLPPASEQPRQGGDAPQVRRNFNETAFFYPHLKTDDKGETQVAFTVPESNTRWRFRVLAHDKKLNTGKKEAFAVSQKELMVTPNLPRFLRHGDKTAVSAKISNLSDGPVSGSVFLEFFDPLTEESIETLPLENRAQTFTLGMGASSDAWWTFDVPGDIDILGVRIIARSEQFSDGEQHALVVLPNRMMVTEALRMDVNGGQTKTFTMDKLVRKSSATAQDYRLTLEFASNPAWYAIQALPSLGVPQSDNAVSLFASYYANSLGAHIGKTFPKVKAMVEAWKKQGGSKETFLSNIEKNKELKNVLLEETPWVLEAKNEAEQKVRLSLLFDLNRSRNLIQSALDKLRELQPNQGGWSWFKGFQPSVSITQYILYGFNQLKELKAVELTEEIRSMQENAISFIDAEAVCRYNDLKKYNKDWRNMKTIPVTDLEYLYVRSGYTGQPMDDEVQEMVVFYRSVVEKNWTRYGLYERALIAVLMGKEGKTGTLEAILGSFREHALHSEEMGMYWANNRSPVFMSQSALSVHTFIMDAFRAGGAKPGEMDEMKRWLLKQKQSQLWETTHATADAVYALLNMGSDWFSAEGKTTVTLGALRVEPESSELGTGYFKESWSRDEITPEMGRVTVAHQGNTPAWGALYRQYFEEMDKIETTDASLDIKKQLFVEQTVPSGKQLVRITEDNPLKVGDKVVVRLTVRTDRDMDFVRLKDMRAAAFEPADQLSGMNWQNGGLYYQTSKDASTEFYFNSLPRGTYLFEYAVYVTRPGSYTNGITTIQSMYAPEFTSHTAGMRIIVKE